MKAKDRLGDGSPNRPGLRRSIRDPSVRPKPRQALRNFDQFPIEEAAQTGAICATFFDRSFPSTALHLPAFLDKGMSGVYIIPHVEITPDAKGKTSESERKMNMKKYQIGIVALVLLAAVSLGLAQGGKDKAKQAQAATGKSEQSHTMITPNDVKWGPAPPALPAGAQMAVLSGDPSKAEPFTIRLKAPDGYKIMPHWHPTDENVTVLEGTFAMGVGEKFEIGRASCRE